ncbi:hypothetical protein Ait01nite_057160 [Actinoplanes italicus]|nr:hypothetical protein Ait01nite_057160 [Actinoplanes italicus]
MGSLKVEGTGGFVPGCGPACAGGVGRVPAAIGYAGAIKVLRSAQDPPVRFDRTSFRCWVLISQALAAVLGSHTTKVVPGPVCSAKAMAPW